MSEQELDVLINAVALNSDRAAFKKLYMQFYSKLFCLSKSLVKRAEDAEEVIDDTFMSIWAKRADLHLVRNFTVYICAAVRNKSLNVIARNKNHQHITLEEVSIDLHDVAPNGYDKLQLAEISRLLTAAVSKMPNQCKLVFKLVKEDGFKYREVAEMLDLSVKTVEYHMGNALKTVWNCLAEDDEPLKKINF